MDRMKYISKKRSKLLWMILIIFLVIDASTSGLFITLLLHLVTRTLDQNAINIFSSSLDIMVGTGFIIVFSPAYFLSAPIMGIASDYWGRKIFLAASFISTCLAYSFVFIGIHSASIFMILLGMLLFGIGSSSLPLNMTVMADISQGVKRAIYFGTLFATLSIMETAAQFNDWLIHIIPFGHTNYGLLLVLTLFELVNFLLAVFILPETNKNIVPRTVTLQVIFLTITKLFSKKETKLILLVLVLFEFTWGLYFENVSFYLNQILHVSQKNTYMLNLGRNILEAITLVILYPILVRYFSLKKIFYTTMLIFCCALIISYLLHDTFIFQVLSIPLIGSVAMLEPTLWTLLADVSENSLRGSAMGIAGPAWALVWTMSGNIVPTLSGHYLYLPLMLGTVMSVMILLILVRQKKQWASI